MPYIKRLRYWSDKDWTNYYKQFPKLDSGREKAQVRVILSSSNKEEIEANFDYLAKFDIVNGIGPSWLSNLTRCIITKLFKGFKSAWHDIMYGIKGTEQDRIDADNGALEYSFKGIAENYKTISNIEMILLPTIFIMLYTPFAILQMIVAIGLWHTVRCFGFTSFNYKEEYE